MTNVLRDTRESYQESLAMLEQISLLDGPTKQMLRPMLRTFECQVAALQRWPGWWYGYHPLRMITALVAIAAPALGAALWVDGWQGRPGDGSILTAALISYTMVGGLVALGYGVHQGRTRRWHVALAACAITLGSAVTYLWLPSADRGWLWRGVGAGVLAAAGLLLLTVARLNFLVSVTNRWARPLARRPAGWLLPPQHAAVRLLTVVDAFGHARATCRHPRWRRNFVSWFEGNIEYLRWELAAVAVDLRFSDVVRRDTADRAARLAGYLRRLQVRLMHDYDLVEYDAVAAETVALVRALAVGDWTPVTESDAELDQPSLAVRLTRRLLPAALLLGTAISLPHIPGVPAQSAALTGIQLGLVAAAALSLLPVEQAHRDQITTAFTAGAK